MKEEKTLMKKILEWWRHFEFEHFKIAPIIVYLTCFLGVLSVCCVLFNVFNLSDYPSCSSVKYMLSALVQSEAAIVAIVITLTVIVFQLSASAYSPRVIDIFKKNVDMWILLLVYGISIFSGFIVLTHVPDEIKDLSPTLSLGISFAFWLGIFSFVALVPYIRDILNLLKPTAIIERLSKDINKTNISHYIDRAGREEEMSIFDDPFHPLINLIKRSIGIDSDIVIVGLNALTRQVIHIINSNNEKEVSLIFCDRIERVAMLSINEKYLDSTKEVIINFKKFGEECGKKNLEDATYQATSSIISIIGAIREKKLEKDFEEALKKSVSVLVIFGTMAVKKNFKKTLEKSIEELKKFNKKIVEKKIGEYEEKSSLEERDYVKKFSELLWQKDCHT